MKNMKTRFV